MVYITVALEIQCAPQECLSGSFHEKCLFFPVIDASVEGLAR